MIIDVAIVGIRLFNGSIGDVAVVKFNMFKMWGDVATTISRYLNSLFAMLHLFIQPTNSICIIILFFNIASVVQKYHNYNF